MKAYVKAKKIIFIFVVVAFLGFVSWGVNINVFKVHKVNLAVKGSQEDKVQLEIIKESIASKLDSFEGKYIWQVPLEKLSLEIEKDRRVKEAKIRRFLTGHIDVELVAHDPIALLLRRQKFYPVGLDGSLLPAVTKNIPNLPILRGDIFFTDHKKRKQVILLLENIPTDNVSTEDQFHRKQISEIHYHKKYGYQLTLVESATEVRMGEKNLAQKVKYLSRVLNYLAGQQLQGRVIDTRFTKKVVVRLRNQP